MSLLFLSEQAPNLLDPSEDILDSGQYTPTNLDILVNNSLAPDDRTTADRCEPTSANSFLQINNETVNINTDYTFSVYLKSTGSDRSISFSIRTTGLALIGDNEIITVTNSWKRFTITRNTASNSVIRCLIGGASTWASGEDLFIWGLQLNKGPLSSYQRNGIIQTTLLISVTDSINNLADFLNGVGEIRTIDVGDDLDNLTDGIDKAIAIELTQDLSDNMDNLTDALVLVSEVFNYLLEDGFDLIKEDGDNYLLE